MSAPKLTEAQRRVLSYTQVHNDGGAWPHRKRNDWSVLYRLKRLGLVMGDTFGRKPWTITDAGRAALRGGS